MEPLSTFNFGRSFTQPGETSRVNNLAAKARQLLNQRPNTGLVPALEIKPLHGAAKGLQKSVDKNSELMEVAQKFESLLIHQMLKAMRQTVQKSDLLNSFSLNQYESMLDEEIANEMAKHKGIGLADSLFYQLSRLESASNQPAMDPNKTPGVNPYE